MKKAKKIFIGNYKGGVGKTTSAYFIGKNISELEENNKVLLLDLDPQSSLSEICLTSVGKDLDKLDDIKTLNYIFDLEIKNIEQQYNLQFKLDMNNFIQKTCYENLDFIPSSLFYSNNNFGLDELAISMKRDIRYFSILSQILDRVEDKYDYIIIDCPPNSNVLTQSAFMAADFYLIPTVVDSISANGIQHYIRTVNKTYKKYCIESEESILYKNIFGEMPQLIGVFFTLLKKTANNVTVQQGLRDNLDSLDIEEDIYIFENSTNHFVEYPRKLSVGKAELETRVNDYDSIFEEFLVRLSIL